MLRPSELTKADMWRRRRWNTNKPRPNKCHYFPFVFTGHAGNGRLGCPRSRGRKKSRNCKILIIYHTQLAACFQRAEEKACVFLWALCFIWFYLLITKSSFNCAKPPVVCVCLFFLHATTNFSYIRVHLSAHFVGRSCRNVGVVNLTRNLVTCWHVALLQSAEVQRLMVKPFPRNIVSFHSSTKISMQHEQDCGPDPFMHFPV